MPAAAISISVLNFMETSSWFNEESLILWDFLAMMQRNVAGTISVTTKDLYRF